MDVASAPPDHHAHRRSFRPSPGDTGGNPQQRTTGRRATSRPALSYSKTLISVVSVQKVCNAGGIRISGLGISIGQGAAPGLRPRVSHLAVNTAIVKTPGRPKASPLAVKSAARGVGVKGVPWIPPWLKRVLTGGRRITVDGNPLDATLQLLLIARRSLRTGGLAADGDAQVARTLMRKSPPAKEIH